MQMRTLKRILITAGVLSVLFIIPKSFATTYLEALPGPQVIVNANPETVNSGDRSTITWNATPNPSTNSPVIGCKGPGSGDLWTWTAKHIPWGFSGADISGSKGVTVSGDTTYTVVCKDKSGQISDNSIDINTSYPFNCISNSECNGWKVSVTASLSSDKLGSHELTAPYEVFPGTTLFIHPVYIYTRFYNTGSFLQSISPWVPKIVECADWSNNIITWGDSGDTKIAYTTPGTHNYFVSCAFTTGNQTISDSATLNVVASTSTPTPTQTPISGSTYVLHVNAWDETNNKPLNVPVTSIKNGTTPLTIETSEAYNDNLPVSVPAIFQSDGQEYDFQNWVFSDGPWTKISNSVSISLNNSLPDRTMTADYTLAQSPQPTPTPTPIPKLQKFYYCNGSACVPGEYDNLAECVHINGTCYPNAACSTSNICGPSNNKQPTPTPPGSGGGTPTKVVISKDIPISINPVNSCLPRATNTNSTNISWNVGQSYSCPTGYTISNQQAVSCSSNLPGGPTTGPSSGDSQVTVNKTTNYSIACNGSYTCKKTYECNSYTQTITNPDGTKTTQTFYHTCTDIRNYTPSASNYTTIHYVNQPTINYVTTTPENILLNKSTSVSWQSNVDQLDNSINTQLYCYPSSGTGDTSGWDKGVHYPKDEEVNGLYPQKTTTYKLTCRNYNTADTGCYNEDSASATVNVYTPSLQETNPSASIENAIINFIKSL